jgi:hypothetical protein
MESSAHADMVGSANARAFRKNPLHGGPRALPPVVPLCSFIYQYDLRCAQFRVSQERKSPERPETWPLPPQDRTEIEQAPLTGSHFPGTISFKSDLPGEPL